MKRTVFFLLAAALTAGLPLRAATNDVPDFDEVAGLLRTHLPGVTDAELNRAALNGVLAAWHGRVALDGETMPSPTNASGETSGRWLDDGMAYVRVTRVGGGLASEIALATSQLARSNRLQGMVLDLRFAGGDDYAAAAAAAELFLTKPRPLLNWGRGMVTAKVRKDPLAQPLAVLINGDTEGAAEALAAVLRETGAGLLLGTNTAGHAQVMREFPLKSGRRLLIAIAPVTLGNGAALPADGVRPDIAVAVKADEERAYMADAYADLTSPRPPAEETPAADSRESVTNRPARKRINEAELLRQRREGADEAEEALPLAQRAAPDKPILRDPVLARAVDLLKGLAVVRQAGAER